MNAAFIGLGTMGASMALNILKAGYSLTVHNRTREKEIPLAEQGAKRAASPREAAAGADVIVICVSDTPDVEEIILGAGGVIEGAPSGAVVVDCSTISAQAARSMGAKLLKKDVIMLDAPVSGGSEGARLGTLTIMVGGDVSGVEKAQPILEAMGRTITHVGPLGAGQLTKAINQIVITGTYLGVAEGMAFGLKAGLDMDKVLAAVNGGAAASWVLDNRAGNMVDNKYPLGFRLKLHRKDLAIALSSAQEMGVSLPVTALAHQVENGLIACGYGDEDLSALARFIRQLSGLE